MLHHRTNILVTLLLYTEGAMSLLDSWRYITMACLIHVCRVYATVVACSLHSTHQSFSQQQTGTTAHGTEEKSPIIFVGKGITFDRYPTNDALESVVSMLCFPRVI